MSLGTIGDATVIPCAISSTRVMKAIKERGGVSLVISCQKCSKIDMIRGQSQWNPQRVSRSFRNAGWEVDAEGSFSRCPDCKKKRRETNGQIPVGKSVTAPPKHHEQPLPEADPAEPPSLRIVHVASGRPSSLTLVPTLSELTPTRTIHDATPACPPPVDPQLPIDEDDPEQSPDPAAKSSSDDDGKPKTTRTFKPKICAYAPCSVSFVPKGPHQRFHCTPCQRAAHGRPASYEAETGITIPRSTPEAKPMRSPEPTASPRSRSQAPAVADPKPDPDLTIASAPPQTPEAIKAERRMYALLDDHYKPDNRQYEPGWHDERVAAESGVAEPRVTFVREGLYGKAVDPFLVVLREDVDAALERLKGERITLNALVRETFDRHEKELLELRARLNAKGA